MLTLLKSLVISLLEYTAASSGFHGRQNTFKLLDLFNERLHTKSPKYCTYTTGKDCTNSNYTLSKYAVNVIQLYIFKR